jgi:hypothetical protein
MLILCALWQPILLSAVIVFVASSIIHMAPLWHKGDYPRVPNEDKLREAVGPLAIPPGNYMVPRAANTQEMKSPAFKEKVKQGPVIFMTVLAPGQLFSMGRNLVLWFIYLLIISAFVGYIDGHVLPPGTNYRHVFKITGLIAFMGYALAVWPMSIWYRRSWGQAFRESVDGVIYGALTAGTFGWLWPH